MDFTIDNNKASEIDNVTQALLMNANTDTKHEMDETNNIFGVTGDHHHLNDKMNNIIDQHNIGNDFLNVVSGGGGDANNLNLIEDKEPSAMFEKACLDNEADMGPETSVDTTDDADNDTDPYECSTLSHSKETLPLDNLLDNKFTNQGVDFDDKPASLASPTTDMPFDGIRHSNDDQIHEEQNILYENAGVSDFEKHYEGCNTERDASKLGEDLSKTEAVTQEIRESVAMSFEYHSDKVTDQDLFENIKSDVNEIADRLESINVGCETSGLPTNKDDLAYNQFTEYIEHGAPSNEQDVNLDNFEMLHQEPLLHPPASMELKFNGNEEHMPSSFLDTPASISPSPESPAVDTPPSISPAPVSPAPNVNSGRLTPCVEETMHLEEKSHDFDQPNCEFGKYGNGDFIEEVKQNEGNNKIDIDESSEHEKYVDEPREHEKNVQKSHVQEKSAESHYDFAEHLEELAEHQEGDGKQSEYEEYTASKSPIAFGDSEYKKDFDELAAIQGNAYDFTYSMNRDGDYAHNENIMDNNHFDEPVVETIETVTVEEKTESVDEKRHDDGDDLLQKMSEDEQVSLATGFVENELKENLAEFISESEPLHESLDETLQMTEHVSEKPTTTIDDNILVSQLTSHDLDEVKEDKLPSLEIHEQHVASLDMMEDKSQIEHKETNPTQLATKESESTTNQEGCDESLDESITPVSKASGEIDEKPIAAVAATLENIIESEEIVPEIESQQTVELNSKEPQAEKTSDICVTEQSEENAEKLISDSLDKEVEDMTSRLNPEAKEFVPSSPPVASFDAKGNLFGSIERFGSDDVISQSPQKGAFSLEDIIVPAEKDFENEIRERPAEIGGPVPHIPVGIRPQLVSCMNGDDLVSQSPQKGAPAMNDFLLPTSSQFEAEVMSRPSELSALDAPESMNLKEAMHEPEKEQISPMEQTNSSLDDSMDIISPGDNLIGKIEDVINSVQMLPDDDEDEGIKTNGSLLPDANTNGDVPLINDISNLKLEDTKLVAEVIGMKTKVEKTTKAPEIKKTEVKPKTSSTGPKKAVSSTSATISDSSKAKTPATISKTKVSAGLTARPRTAPAPSSKPSSTEKKSSTNVISARAKPDTKSSPVGVKKLPQTKPKTEESKAAVRQVASKVASTATRNPTTSRTASTTSTTTATATKRSSAVSTTNSTATKTTAGPRPALSPSSKPTAVTSTHKPAISPRSTVTSTLRKSEALKSPTSAPLKTAAAKPAVSSSSSTVTKTSSKTSAVGSMAATKTTTTTTMKKSTSSTTKSATGTTAAAKKPPPIKRPLGHAAATGTAVKPKPITSPTKTAADEAMASEIKMNGTSTSERASTPAITVNGDSKD